MRKAIYLADSKLEEHRYSRLNPWLEANEIDPATVVFESVVHVDEGYITFAAFTFYDDGTRKLNMGGSAGYLKVFRTVPLLSAPENFNL